MERTRLSTSSNPESSESCTDVVFMGNARVGKTSLLQRILRMPDPAAIIGRYIPTIEDSYVRRFLVGEQCCQLRLVDTTGSYMFPAMQRLWVRRAAAFVLVCARDDASSIEHINTLVASIQQERPTEWRKIPLVLVVNKCDLDLQEWKVSDEEVESVADELDIPYSSIVFASAKTDSGITELMKNLWRQNEENGGNCVTLEPVPNSLAAALLSKRRSSAFSNIFSSGPNSRRSSGNQVSETTRVHTGSVGDAVPEPNTHASPSPRMSKPEILLAKTMNKLHIGTHDGSRRRSSELRNQKMLIEFDCNIS